MTNPGVVLVPLLLFFLLPSVEAAQQKPKLSLDDAFNSVDFTDLKLSPDGSALVIATTRADWEQSTFRKDLWLCRSLDQSNAGLIALTQSGRDSDPQWSPDGRWIAFLSGRESRANSKAASGEGPQDDKPAQLFVIPLSGGEAFPITLGEEEVHAFAWSTDSKALYYATRAPETQDEKDTHEKEWKDTLRYRGGERGDVIFRIDLGAAMAQHSIRGARDNNDADKASDATPGAHAMTSTPWRIEELAASPDGTRLAFVTNSVSEREEKIEEFEIFTVDLRSRATPRQLTRNQAVEHALQWSRDSKHIFFETEIGAVEGEYKDTEPHLFWVDVSSGKAEQWAQDLDRAITQYTVASDGSVIAAGRQGTEVQLYASAKASASLAEQPGRAGTYELTAAAQRSPRIAFVHSTTESPSEVYTAESISRLGDAKAVTSFNRLFTERDLPRGKPYRWKADDGTTVEGMLMYPPGKFEAKNLPVFVFIHGGPADADGNHFESDWYQWDRLAATQGWLVFEPNYRGSTGYGDKFLQQIVPQLVSRPGKDILEGVDALVKDGIADPSHLAVGGYSYGGYMTNWLITQTTRFRAAVTGAGAVEHVANWGNDDTTFDDAYFLGGLPWEAAQRYHDEAAIYQINKVHTPTHLVAGADDIRVAIAEDYLLDHALHNLGVPSELLVFPGEGHSLKNNPWHGKIKVREELKWLQKYGGISAEN